jgi:hypothetical protein
MNLADFIVIQPTNRRTNLQSPTMRDTSHARLNAFQSFIVAGTAGALSRSFVNGFSVLKICAEVGVPGYKMGALQGFVWAYRLEGLGAYAKGLMPAVVRSFPHIGIQFTVFDQLAKRFVPSIPRKENPTVYSSVAIYFCGGYAGAAATVVTHPLDVIKVRLVAQGNGMTPSYNGVFDCFSKIIKSDGIFGLYRGIIPSVVGAFLFSGEMFMLWDWSQRVPWVRRNASFVPYEWFLWACVAVATASAVAHPFDVLRRKMMAYDPKLPRNGRVDVKAGGVVQTFFNIYRQNGLPGYLHGYFANMFKVVPQVAVFYLTYKSVQNIMIYTSGSQPKKQATN